MAKIFDFHGKNPPSGGDFFSLALKATLDKRLFLMIYFEDNS